MTGSARLESAGLVLLGVLGGLVLGVALTGLCLDRVSFERDQLLVRAADLEMRVERLQERLDEALSCGPGPIVEKVTLELNGLDDVTRLEVRAQVAKLVEDLVGMNLSDIDSALAYHLVDGRTVACEDRTVNLSVRAVVLGPETAYWVDLTVDPDEDGSSVP